MVYTIDDIKTKLTPIFQENKVTKAILFGSYAKGEATEYSDVDIVIESPPFESGLDFYNVLGCVSDALQKQVDLITYKSIDTNDKIYHEITNSGKVIYEQ